MQTTLQSIQAVYKDSFKYSYCRNLTLLHTKNHTIALHTSHNNGCCTCSQVHRQLLLLYAVYNRKVAAVLTHDQVCQERSSSAVRSVNKSERLVELFLFQHVPISPGLKQQQLQIQ